MKKINFTPFPILMTERLILRQLSYADELAVFLLRTNESVNKYIERQKIENNNDARAFIERIDTGVKENQFVFWSISLKEKQNLIGTISLWNFSEDKFTGELGYEMNPVFQGKGFMDEAVKAVLDYGFNSLGFKRIEAFTHYNNERSKLLLKKNGFHLEEGMKDEGNANNIIYSLEVEIKQ